MKSLRFLAAAIAVGCLFDLSFSTSALSQTVTKAWASRYEGDFGRDFARAVTPGPEGSVVVIGESTGVEDGYDYATVKYDANGNELWVARYNGPAGSDDYATSVAVDGDGNVYVTGYSFGVGTGWDYTTIKYDENGNELWVARYNGADEFSGDFARKIAVDSAGNVYVTGESEENRSENNGDITTIKYDADGNELWVAHYNGPGSDHDAASGLGIEGTGSVYVSGYSAGSGTDDDYVTIKYDADGNELWVRRYDGPANSLDRPASLALDGMGNPCVTGRSIGLGTAYDYATVKYDPDGNQLWVRRYNGPDSLDDQAHCLAVDGAGNVYVSGESEKAVSNGNIDYATVKYDPDGNEMWVALYTGPSDGLERAVSITVDLAGTVHVTGLDSSHYGTVSYDTNGNELWAAVSADTGVPVGVVTDGYGNVIVSGSCYGYPGCSDDYITVKYDPDGGELWLAWYDGPGSNPVLDEEPVSLAVDAVGNSYVAGTGGSGHDYATVKYDPAGEELWTARYSGPSHLADQAHAMHVDSGGNVYVTGSSEGSDLDTDYATVKYDPDGNEMWVVRYDGPSHLDDQAYGMAGDGGGNVYVTGSSQGSETGLDYVTIKYDPDGNELWQARHDGASSDDDEACCVAVDAAGNVYVTGYSRNLGVGGYDYATVKYDPDGNEMWVSHYDGPASGVDKPRALALDPEGGVIVTGNSSEDYATVKYDSDGNELWARRYNGPGNSEDEATSIGVDLAGNVYVTGKSTGVSTWLDYATLKYDPEGNELWVRRYNFIGDSWDVATSLGLDDHSNVYVTGASFGGITGNDYATIKYDTDGNTVWVVRYNDPNDRDDEATCLALDGSGSVFVTGRAKFSYFGFDYLTVKYTQVEAPEWSMGAPAQATTLGEKASRSWATLNYSLLSIPFLAAGIWRALRRRVVRRHLNLNKNPLCNASNEP